MASVSPHGHLAELGMPVLLLHGSADSVIPATESLWLGKEVPPSELRRLLISPLITHVELGGQPGWRDKVALLGFMAAMFRESGALRP
jgi:pimeloyl-ACP methyl ester carboxylesterase